MARFPWLQQIDIPYDENGMPVSSGVSASIMGPEEPLDSGEISGTTRQMFDTLVAANAFPGSASEADADAGTTLADAIAPQQATPNWLQPQQAQQAQAPTPAPQVQAQPPVAQMPAMPPQQMQQAPQQPQGGGGNFLSDLAYNAVGGVYTPWERNQQGQWGPNRDAGIGAKIGTAIGSLLRAAPGVQYSPSGRGGMGTFRYDPYAGSYLNRQRNDLMMRAGQMNDQFDPYQQALAGQASGSRIAAYRQAAGIPAPRTQEEQIQDEIARQRALDDYERTVHPEKYWTPEQKQQLALDTLAKEQELRSQYSRSGNDPMETVRQGWQILDNYHNNPTPENRWYATMVTGESDPDVVIQRLFAEGVAPDNPPPASSPGFIENTFAPGVVNTPDGGKRFSGYKWLGEAGKWLGNRWMDSSSGLSGPRALYPEVEKKPPSLDGYNVDENGMVQPVWPASWFGAPAVSTNDFLKMMQDAQAR